MGEEGEVKLGVYGNLYYYKCANPQCGRNPAVTNTPENRERLYLTDEDKKEKKEYCSLCREELRLKEQRKI